MKIIITTIFAQLLFINSGLSQISVSEHSADVLVNEVLSGYSISISNITYTGSPSAIGYFSGNATNIPFENGLFITTGDIQGVLGPNNNQSTTTENNFNQNNSNLSGLASGNSCFNQASIAFDFVPVGDSLMLEYIFGSEEYQEYVGGPFSDVFGIFVSGPGISGVLNIAKLPDGQTVAVNNVNDGNPAATPPVPASNPTFFVYNGTGSDAPYNTSDSYIQYDGFTVPLTASSMLIPNETYHLEIAIADVTDELFDSGVFLKAHSLTANTTEFNLSDALSLSPNPAVDFVTINYKRDAPGKVKVYDVTGRYFGEYHLNSLSQTKISLGDLPAGMYTLKFITTEGQCSKLISRI